MIFSVISIGRCGIRRGWPRPLLQAAACALALTIAAAAGEARAAASISFTYVPPLGSFDDLEGQVSGVAPASYKVAVYIRVEGEWWTKPYWDSPLTAIGGDGSWTCDITTGGADQTATRIAAYLVPNGYSPPLMSGQATLPAELEANSAASVTVDRYQSRTLSFSGRTWNVKKSASRVEPGPNYFSDNAADVWVDGSGRLHLRIVYRNGAWYATEVYTADVLGYGTYTFTLASRVDQLDKNVVLGLFTWDDNAPQYNYRELDIELSRWGEAAGKEAQFVVQPWTRSGNRHRFFMTLLGSYSTHRFIWSAGSVLFSSYQGQGTPPGGEIESWTYAGGDVPPEGGATNARINLWLLDGGPPSDGQEVEVIVESFDYQGPPPPSTPTPTPLPTAIPTPSASDTVRVGAIGDYGEGGQAEADVASLVKGWSPDIIITSGDNNYSSGSASTIDYNIGQFYHEYIYPYTGGYGGGAAGNRFFPTLGNHDWYTSGAQPYLDYFTLPGNERYYDFTWGPVHFFAVDSDSNEPDGATAGSAQASWLQNALAAATEPWKVVYFHHAPYSSSEHGSKTRMQWPFQAWGATAVINGHDHTYERIMKSGFPYFVNGIGGSSRYSFNSPVSGSTVRYRADYGAMLIEASPDYITFQFITRAGSLIDSFTLYSPVAPSLRVNFQSNTSGSPPGFMPDRGGAYGFVGSYGWR